MAGGLKHRRRHSRQVEQDEDEWKVGCGGERSGWRGKREAERKGTEVKREMIERKTGRRNANGGKTEYKWK